MDVPRAAKPKANRNVLYASSAITLLIATVALGRIRNDPVVDRSAVTLDTVQRGELLREVRAAGALVPENVHWLSALSAGRIERVHVQPGAHVVSGQVLLEMTNPDVRLEVLEAERLLSGADAALVTLAASLETQRLSQIATVATTRSLQREAARQAKAKSALVKQEVISPMEAELAVDQAAEFNERLRIEEERLQTVVRAAKAQIAVQRAEIERLQAIVAFQRGRLAALTLRAAAPGVVQEIPTETGQWINPGQTLVKLHSTGRLKAVLRVPELEAKDIALQQQVRIDTRNGVVQGRVTRVSPQVQDGVVAVDVGLPETLPRGARPDLSVDGVIEVERIANTLHVGRVADAQANSSLILYRLTDDNEAARVRVRVGRLSVSAMEIEQGLQAGDVVIVSTLPLASSPERIRIKR